MSQLFPIFLKLHGKSVLIVGGSAVAAQKLSSLQHTGARVTVLAPRIAAILAEFCEGISLAFNQRAYRSEDLAGVSLVFAATGDPALNRRVVEEAAAQGIPANAVDDPGVCQFYSPSVMRRGELILAFSTSGKFAGMSKAVREAFETLFPGEDSELLHSLYDLRRKIRGGPLEPSVRSRALRELIAGFSKAYLTPGEDSAPGEITTTLAGVTPNNDRALLHAEG